MNDMSPATASSAAETLSRYATSLRFESLPPAVVARAKACLIDAVACAVFGRTLPWSRMILSYAQTSGAGGACRLPGPDGIRLYAPQAALALGSFAHAYELDSLRKPGAGVHPGATVALPALIMGQQRRASGKEVLAAIIAGCEVMFRIGAATLHTPEKVGFHAPGLTGPFGAAVASGHILGLSSREMTSALGIAGSMASGLLAFARAGEGGMVKRLHLGRAAEGGVMAASLAAQGYEAPRTVLEGEFGVLDVFCGRSDAALLTAGLGEIFETENICFKSYPCHITAHAPIQLLRRWMEEHRFSGHDIREVTIRGSQKIVSHHNIMQPADMMLAQYSVPFCVALAALRDPADPASFAADALRDPAILDLAQRVRMDIRQQDGVPAKGWGVEMEVRLGDRHVITGSLDSFTGCPEQPFTNAAIAAKFRRLTADMGETAASALLDFLNDLENVDDVSAWPEAGAAAA